MPLFRQNVRIGLLFQNGGKGFFVPLQKLCHSAQLQLYHMFYGIGSDIVPGRASTTVVLGIVGATEKTDFVDGIYMKPQLLAAVSAIEQVSKHTLLAVLLVGSAAFRFADPFLHLFKGTPFDNGFMDILEHCPVFFRIVEPRLLFEGFGVGLEIDHITAIFLQGQNLCDGGFAPLIGIILPLGNRLPNTVGLPVFRRNRHLVFLQCVSYGFISFPLQSHSKNPSHHRCRLRFNHPLFLIFWGFHITIRRLTQRFAGIATDTVS